MRSDVVELDYTDAQFYNGALISVVYKYEMIITYQLYLYLYNIQIITDKNFHIHIFTPLTLDTQRPFWPSTFDEGVCMFVCICVQKHVC